MDWDTMSALTVAWIPLLGVLVLWWVLWRWGGLSRQRQLIERSFEHMERVEQKLDELLDLLRSRNRD